MKTIHVVLILAALMITGSCQEKVDIAAEKAAIIKVINEETQAYLDYDYEKVISFYVQDSLNFRLTTGADNYVFLEGWDEVEQFFMDELEVEESEELEADSNIKVEKDDYRIKVYDKSAYVLCTETWTYHTPEGPVNIRSRQVRFMEKVEDEWKIAFLSFIGTSGYDEDEVEDADLMDQ